MAKRQQMNPELLYELGVWTKAEKEAEDCVLRKFTPEGGRMCNESVEDYVKRSRDHQDGVLIALALARKRLKEIQDKCNSECL